MSDRSHLYESKERETAPLDHPEHLREPLIAAGVGGVVAGPLDAVDDVDNATDNAVDEEQDWESPEGDEGLLSGHSPEFERLTKPTH